LDQKDEKSKDFLIQYKFGTASIAAKTAISAIKQFRNKHWSSRVNAIIAGSIVVLWAKINLCV
jgi:hypothetical protein